VHIVKEKGRYFFESEGTPGIPLHLVDRLQDDDWMTVVEDGLNTSIDTAMGPLLHCTYLCPSGEEVRGEIVLVLHHTIVDAACAASLIHELLSLCATLQAGGTPEGYARLDVLPSAEELFPPAFKGLGRLWHTLVYMLRQMGDEVGYRWRARGKRVPPINEAARGKILPRQMSEESTTALVRRARKEKVTLNSILNAAMLLAVWKHIYQEQDTPLRTFTFAGLRPYLIPPVSDEHLVSYVTMMRFTTQMHAGSEFWALAHELHNAFYRSFKRGDKFAACLISASLIKMVFGLKVFRMGTTAVAYTGVPKIKNAYGPIRVLGVRGFVSNFGLGPEYSAQTRIFDGKLLWDILYLDTDMDHATAQAIADEIHAILEAVIGAP
jgi:hypothetical protein